MKKGVLITIEGTDGSGKGTQAKLLVDTLNANNMKTVLFSFPGYAQTLAGAEIGKMLNGEYPLGVSKTPRLASMLFAVDRFEQKQTINNLLETGVNVVCDRYVESNIAYQTTQNEDKEAITDWIEKLEYEVFEMPVPRITFFLDVPYNISSKLVCEKDKRVYTNNSTDEYEGDRSLIKASYNRYKELAEDYGWITIGCTNEYGILPKDHITSMLYTTVEKYTRE